jgi:hypothetical protein
VDGSGGRHPRGRGLSSQIMTPRDADQYKQVSLRIRSFGRSGGCSRGRSHAKPQSRKKITRRICWSGAVDGAHFLSPGETTGLFDEIVVVDTGSVDRTREIARSFGATVVDFAWCDDFSAARNMAMSRCTCDYIFWLDADETLPRVSAARLRRLLNGGLEQETVYVIHQISNRSDGSFGLVETLSPRLCPNHSGVRWSRRAYEEILPTARANGLTPRFIDISVDHFGFARPATLLSSGFAHSVSVWRTARPALSGNPRRVGHGRDQTQPADRRFLRSAQTRAPWDCTTRACRRTRDSGDPQTALRN